MKPFAIVNEDNEFTYFSSKEKAISSLSFEKRLNWESFLFIETKFGYITIEDAMKRKSSRK